MLDSMSMSRDIIEERYDLLVGDVTYPKVCRCCGETMHGVSIEALDAGQAYEMVRANSILKDLQ